MRRSTSNPIGGFSLVELMFAMVITLGIGLVVFQLFLSNERVFRDQTLILEMQQSTRAVASMIADELRKAGQGAPIYSTRHEAAVAEAAQPFLDGTSAQVVRFRAGLRNASTTVEGYPPSYTLNTATTLTVGDINPIRNAAPVNAGRFVYLWGPTENSWSWVRAEITTYQPGNTSVSVTPRQMSGQGGTFAGAHTIFLEEGVSYRLNDGSVMRGTTGDFANLTAPAFSELSVGDNFTELEFTYYDDSGAQVNPTTVELRSGIRRVDFTLVGETSGPLANGSSPTYPVTMTVYPRNLRIR